MKFLVDAQLPKATCLWIAEHGHDALHVESLSRKPLADLDIAEWAEREGFIVISKDEDFVLIRHRRRFGLVWLRCGNTTNRAFKEWLNERWPRIEALLLSGNSFIELH